MKKYKILVFVVVCMMMVLCMTACGTGKEENKQNRAESNKDTLVVVFSATGTTKGVAERIAAITDADLYKIVPAQAYSSEDLNYNDPDSRATKEQNNPSVRPEIGSKKIDLSGYSRVFIGYPIWFGQEPRIMDTFVETYDFGSITVIPFCTSGSSGIGQSGKHLKENAGSGNWLEGQRFSGNVSEDELHSLLIDEWTNLPRYTGQNGC